jgi:hypothetical protein
MANRPAVAGAKPLDNCQESESNHSFTKDSLSPRVAHRLANVKSFLRLAQAWIASCHRPTNILVKNSGCRLLKKIQRRATHPRDRVRANVIANSGMNTNTYHEHELAKRFEAQRSIWVFLGNLLKTDQEIVNANQSS